MRISDKERMRILFGIGAGLIAAGEEPEDGRLPASRAERYFERLGRALRSGEGGAPAAAKAARLLDRALAHCHLEPGHARQALWAAFAERARAGRILRGQGLQLENPDKVCRMLARRIVESRPAASADSAWDGMGEAGAAGAEGIEALLAAGAPPNGSWMGKSPLWAALENGDAEGFDRLEAGGASLGAARAPEGMALRLREELDPRWSQGALDRLGRLEAERERAELEGAAEPGAGGRRPRARL